LHSADSSELQLLENVTNFPAQFTPWLKSTPAVVLWAAKTTLLQPEDPGDSDRPSYDLFLLPMQLTAYSTTHIETRRNLQISLD